MSGKLQKKEEKHGLLEKKFVGSAVRRFFSIYRFVTLFCIGIIILFPILNMLTIAFRPLGQLADPTVVWIPKSLTLENMEVAWDALDYTRAALNSMFMTLCSTALQVISCSMAGYGFARFKFRGREFLFMLVLFTILVPPQTIIIPKYLGYWQFDYFGIGSLIGLITGNPLKTNILGSHWVMLIPAMLGNGIRGGLFIYIFRQAFRGMPKELEEAAYIDGCGPFRAFVKVMIPGASTSFVTVIIFSIVWYWNDYLNTSMFMSNIPTVSNKLATLKSTLQQMFFLADTSKFGNADVNPYRISAALQSGCLLAILPLLIMYLFLQRYFTESIERTGIVG